MKTIVFHYTDTTRSLGYGVSASGLSLVRDLNDKQTIVATFTSAAEGEIFKAALELIQGPTIIRRGLFR